MQCPSRSPGRVEFFTLAPTGIGQKLSGVTSVTATKGSDTSPCSIGKGKDGSSNPSSCGTVTIGGTEYAGGIAESPYTYQP